MRIFLLIISLVLLSSFRIAAQPDQYNFLHIDTDKGLSHNRINCILKDSKGFMWFGTNSGLNRYDGNEFRVFRHDLKAMSITMDSMISISVVPKISRVHCIFKQKQAALLKAMKHYGKKMLSAKTPMLCSLTPMVTVTRTCMYAAVVMSSRPIQQLSSTGYISMMAKESLPNLHRYYPHIFLKAPVV